MPMGKQTGVELSDSIPTGPGLGWLASRPFEFLPFSLSCLDEESFRLEEQLRKAVMEGVGNYLIVWGPCLCNSVIVNNQPVPDFRCCRFRSSFTAAWRKARHRVPEACYRALIQLTQRKPPFSAQSGERAHPMVGHCTAGEKSADLHSYCVFRIPTITHGTSAIESPATKQRRMTGAD
jgi:hypothetical protein